MVLMLFDRGSSVLCQNFIIPFVCFAAVFFDFLCHRKVCRKCKENSLQILKKRYNGIEYLEKKMEDYKTGRLKLAEHELCSAGLPREYCGGNPAH